METFVKTRPLAGLCVLVTLFSKDDGMKQLVHLTCGVLQGATGKSVKRDLNNDSGDGPKCI